MLGLLLFGSILSVCCGAINIEKYLKVCNRNSLELNQCMKGAVQDGIAVLSDGVEEIEIPALDPYYQKELKVEYKNNQILASIILKNIYVEGLKKATVHDARVRADDDQVHIEIDLTAPKIVIRSDYEGVGQYNDLKIKAHGTVRTVMTDLVFTWKLDGVSEKNGDEKYIHINSFYMRPDVGKMQISMTNNNPETKDLTEFGLRFINENWRTLYKELLPFAQSNWDKIGTQFANNIFMKVPYDQILPPN
uniref:Juvenile hormone binding protein 2 n=1 Tax=Antheraea pernyi TaxID=7119 RepID=A0A1V0J8W4_ANTPE|nr:juvenile hormone binding protein 2 [Antheraea pernyi]